MNEDPDRQKILELIRALVTFGGDKTMAQDAEVNVLPNSPVGYTAGIHWDPNGNQPDNQNEDEDLRAQQMRQKFLMRQFQK